MTMKHQAASNMVVSRGYNGIQWEYDSGYFSCFILFGFIWYVDLRSLYIYMYIYNMHIYVLLFLFSCGGSLTIGINMSQFGVKTRVMGGLSRTAGRLVVSNISHNCLGWWFRIPTVTGWVGTIDATDAESDGFTSFGRGFILRSSMATEQPPKWRF